MLDWLEELRKSNKLIIVEGKKDLIALEKLGLKNVYAILRKPLYKVVEETASKHKEVIILTDLDKEGRRLYSILKKGLQRFGVKVDDNFREFLFRHTKLRQIEGIEHYLEKNVKKFIF